MSKKPEVRSDVRRGTTTEKQGSTSNAQNIQSKLLGANISEISIEKFRNPPQQTWYGLNGLLKTISSKFTIELIFVLDLSNQNLTNVDTLADCTNLMMLNLNNNQIKDLFALSKLLGLMFLSISGNQVHSLDYLRGLLNLKNLQAQANNLKSVKSVQCLEECKNLRTLYFQSLGGNNPNPLCELEDYRRVMLQTFQQVQRLDGVKREIVKFNNGREIKKNNKNELKIELGNTGYWFTQKYPNVDTQMKMESDEKFNQTSNQCKQLISTIEMKLKLLEC